LPSTGARIYIFNHASMFDIILLFLLPENVKIMVKESYTEIPLLGTIIKKNEHVILKSGVETDEQNGTFDSAVKTLESGFPLVVFPEGTRSKDGNISRFKTGAFKIAYATQAEIIPVVIDSWNIVRPGDGLIFRDTKLYSKVMDSYKYEDYKNINVNDFTKELRKKMFIELRNLREIRVKKEKKYYRKTDFFIKLDKKAYDKVL